MDAASPWKRWTACASPRYASRQSRHWQKQKRLPDSRLLKTLTSRLLYTLPVLWLVVSVVFLLIHLVPGDPIQQMLGEGAAAADIEAARHAYGLDQPLSTQYLHYWKGVLTGDFGQSIRFGQN